MTLMVIIRGPYSSPTLCVSMQQHRIASLDCC